MAIEFVKVRRKDDPTVTSTIARSALRVWAEWEPIPAPGTDTVPERSESAKVTETARVSKAPEPSDAPDPEPKKRRAAATDTKGEK